MRVHHYIKNLLVFAALACSGQLFEVKKLLACVLGFTAFCSVSSVVYIINDIRDAENDRRHPTKRSRPIAAGAVSVKSAIILIVCLLLIACVCTALSFNPASALLLTAYLAINLGYSLGLKKLPIVDITILTAGFLLRVLYGAAIADISVSNWLYLTVMAASFYFSLGKRRNELRKTGSDETRQVLRYYPIAFLDKSMGMCLTLTNVFYALWSMDSGTVSHYNGSRLVLSVPFVLLITLKYSLAVEGESDGDPVEVLLHDKLLLCLCILYLIFMFTMLYF